MDIDLNVLNHFGAKNSTLIAQGQVWRLVTALFLHGNLMHIFLNMMALLGLGRVTEALFGWQRTLFFYIVAGVVGNIASTIYSPHVLSIGASGAIMGLAGVLLAASVKNWKMFGPLGSSLLRSVAFILIVGFLLRNYIDNAAHIGGLLAGFVMALPTPVSPAETPTGKLLDDVLGWGTVIVVALSFASLAISFH